MQAIRLLLTSTVPCALSACAALVSGTSTTFYENPLPPQGTAIELLASDKMDRTEWLGYRQHFVASLNRAGYKTANGELPDPLFVVIQWGAGLDPMATGESHTTTKEQVSGETATTKLDFQTVVARLYASDPRVADQPLEPIAMVRVISSGYKFDIAESMPGLARMVFSQWPNAVSGRAYNESFYIPTY